MYHKFAVCGGGLSVLVPPVINKSMTEDEEKSGWRVHQSHSAMYAGGKLQFNSDGKFFACVFEGNINFVNSDTGALMFKLNKEEEEEEEGAERITTFCLHPNNLEIVTASSNQLIRRWNIKEALERCHEEEEIFPIMMRSWKGHDGPISCADFHHSGDLLVTGSSDRTVKVWNLKGGYCTHNFRGHASVVSSVVFNKDPKCFTLASSDFGGDVFIWDMMIQTNKVHSSSKAGQSSHGHLALKNHSSAVTAVCFADHDLVFTAGRDKVICAWKGDTLLTTFPVMESIEGMQLLPNSLFPEIDTKQHYVLATAGDKGIIRTWNFTLTGNSGKMSCVHTQYSSAKAQTNHYTDLLQTDTYLVGITFDNIIKFIDPKSLNRTKQIVGFNDEIIDLKYLPGEQNKVVMANSTNHLAIVDLETFNHEVLSGHSAIIMSLDVSGKYIVSGSKDNTARVWDASNLECIALCRGHTEGVSAVCILDINESMISKLQNKKRSNGSGIGKLSPPCVVSASSDKTLKFWSFASGNSEDDHETLIMACRHTKVAHEKVINTIASSPNKALVATGSQDKTIKLWETSDYTLKGVLKGHRRGVWNVQFSPVERCLASASADKTIRIWSISDMSCITVLEGHSTSCLRVQYVGNGTQIISGSSDGVMKVWSLRDSQCIGTMDDHNDRIWALAAPPYSPDAPIKEIVSGGGDGRLLVWKDMTEELNAQKARQSEEEILLEEELFSCVRKKDYVRASMRAISLQRPHRFKTILEMMISQKLPGQDIGTLVRALDHEQLFYCWELARDWNTYARNSVVAQQLVQNLMLVDIPLSAAENVKGIIEPFLAYSERHFQRLDKLVKDSFLVDHALACMGEL